MPIVFSLRLKICEVNGNYMHILYIIGICKHLYRFSDPLINSFAGRLPGLTRDISIVDGGF